MMRLVAVSVLVLLAGDAMAQTPEFGGELRLQLDFGGDTIESVEYSDGSTSDLDAGNYATLGLGGSMIPFRSGAHALELAAFAGWGSWSTGPENTEDRLGLTRFPVELLAGYRIDLPGQPYALRFGGGVQYQFVSGISGSGSLEGVDLDVENALGWVAEIRGTYEILALSLRYTKMEYRAPAIDTTWDASSVGVALGLVFPPAQGG